MGNHVPWVIAEVGGQSSGVGAFFYLQLRKFWGSNLSHQIDSRHHCTQTHVSLSLWIYLKCHFFREASLTPKTRLHAFTIHSCGPHISPSQDFYTGEFLLLTGHNLGSPEKKKPHEGIVQIRLAMSVLIDVGRPCVDGTVLRQWAGAV